MSAQIKVTMNLSNEFLAKYGERLSNYGLTREGSAFEFTGPLHRWRSLAEDIGSNRLRMQVDEAAKRA